MSPTTNHWGCAPDAPLAVQPARQPSLPVRAATWCVRGYQRLAARRRSPCRFVPSCSSYTLAALEDQGLVHGGHLSVRRILRCNPWGPAGWDPVPARMVPKSTDHAPCGAPNSADANEAVRT